MDNITIYTVILGFLLGISIKRKYNLIYILILSYYFAVGVMGIIGVRIAGLDYYQEQTTILPYLFLIVCYIIHFLPLMQSDNEFGSKKISSESIPHFNILLYAFLITGTISILLYINPVLNLISSGSWRSNRIVLLNDEMVYPYSNFIEYIILNFANYCALPAQIVSIVVISRNRDTKIGWVTLIVSIVYKVLTCLYTSSRGGIFNLLILTVALFVFFMKDIKKATKFLFAVLGIIGLSIIYPIIVSITTDRFGASFASTSIWRYFGQPAIMFSYGVAPIEKLSYGKFAFSTLFNTGYSYSNTGGRWIIGGDWGSTFYTFVGFEYIDWGPIGCILIGLLLAYLMKKIISKKEYRISDLYLIFVYIHFLINGCLVIGRNYTLQIILSLVIYWLMRVMERTKPLPRIRLVLRKVR